MKQHISTNTAMCDPNSYTNTLQISMFKNTGPDELAYNRLKKRRRHTN
jgi:hypothetical protein